MPEDHEDWRLGALCLQYPSEMFFPEVWSEVYPAKRVCRLCPVKDECLSATLEMSPQPEGIFAGLGKRSREKLHRKMVLAGGSE